MITLVRLPVTGLQ